MARTKDAVTLPQTFTRAGWTTFVCGKIYHDGSVKPAITTHNQGNHAVRTERWRYIRYADGSEELYDEQSDPNEWTNLAADPAHAATKAGLAKWLPTPDVPAARAARRACSATIRRTAR